MKAEDLTAFQAAIARLSVRLGVEVPPLALEVWWEDLAPYPIEAVCQALREVGRERKYSNWPPIAVVLDKLEPPSEEALETEAIEAWNQCMAAIKGAGWGAVPELAWKTARYVSGGGRFGDWDSNDTPFRRKEFVETYKTLARREQREERKALGAPEHDALPASGEVKQLVSGLADHLKAGGRADASA